MAFICIGVASSLNFKRTTCRKRGDEVEPESDLEFEEEAQPKVITSR